MIPDSPHIAVKSAWMRPRFSTVNRSPAMIAGNGIMTPAPMPWTARKRTSCSIDCAAPHSSDPNRNRTMPASSTFFLPYMSDNRPAIGASTVVKII
jgi:hypothetical protein